ncbi:4Fe-4S dicluster domain-containing protein [Cellvibrio sp. UBA7661]|uniref:4Fe-4S dicluster domain-containing protein n=1 Tax=Cellvibrio sp. UBA7661 TaxID=1946311 RepID=UPI002F35E39A
MKKTAHQFLLEIDGSCINCDMCVPECPSDAIAMGERHYVINIDTCIRCEGYYPSPTCVAVCPIDSVRKKIL